MLFCNIDVVFWHHARIIVTIVTTGRAGGGVQGQQPGQPQTPWVCVVTLFTQYTTKRICKRLFYLASIARCLCFSPDRGRPGIPATCVLQRRAGLVCVVWRSLCFLLIVSRLMRRPALMYSYHQNYWLVCNRHFRGLLWPALLIQLISHCASQYSHLRFSIGSTYSLSPFYPDYSLMFYESPMPSRTACQLGPATALSVICVCTIIGAEYLSAFYGIKLLSAPFTF